MPIKVAFGATNLFKGLSNQGIDGIGHYCQELLNQFVTDSRLEITPYSFGHSANQITADILPVYPQYLLNSAANHAFTLLGNQKKPSPFGRFDLVHVTDQLIPIHVDCPVVATVMDVIPITHPHLTPSKLAILKGYIWKKLSRSADHIITISEFSKQEIAKHMNYPQDYISVIPLGVDQRYFDRIDPQVIHTVIQKFHLPSNFFLHIGTIQPRKNIMQVLAAHAMLPGAYAQQYPLVLAGKYGWGNKAQYKTIEQAVKEGRCIWINFVTDLEKRALLQSAMAMTFVSLYEGFGLPIVEAFASQTPVITSANSSMIEVAGNAAVLVDPNSTDEIKNALLKIIEDQALRDSLIQLGSERAKQYPWENTASQTAAIYNSLI
jgi:alpha-1,3-rhamnosyl/mannosyltransferase